MSKITYGEQKINIASGLEIRAFDISFSGKMDATILLSQDWVVISNNNKIIGFTTGESIVDATDIVEYLGNITIKGCSIATSDQLYACTVEHPNILNAFNDSKEQFDSSLIKLNESSVLGTKVRDRAKTSIRHTNLTTKMGEYYYDNGASVKPDTLYHIDLIPRQARIGGIPIYEKLETGKLLDFKKVVKPKPLRIRPNKLKQYVKKLKAKASSGTAGPRTGRRQQGSEGTSYGGGGSE